MSPKFAQYVDPVFMCVFALLDRIDRGEDPPPEAQHQIINDQIGMAENQLVNTGQLWTLVKYALVSWIDEMVLKADKWSGRTWWQSHKLEWQHFRSEEANEHYYVRAKEAAEFPGGDDALETYYVCFMLGFRGVYRPEEQAKDGYDLVIRKFALPSDPETWASGMAAVIQQRRNQEQAGGGHAPERSIVTAVPLWQPTSLLWPWVLALIVAGLSIVLYCQGD